MTRTIRVLIMAAVLAVTSSILLAGTASAATKDDCPSPFSVGYSCVFQPATVDTTSHTHIVVKKTVTEQVKQYQTANNVVVGFSVMPNGLPKSQQHNCRWGDAAWSAWQTTNGVVWAPKGHHGWTHACLVNGVWRQIGADGQWNCGNPIKWMGQQPPRGARIVTRIVTFRSVKTFQSTYDKWVSTHIETTYTCKPPWTLTYINGVAWCFIATQVPGQPTLCTDTTANNYNKPLPCTYNTPPVNKNLTCDSVTRTVGDRVVNISDVGWTSSGYVVDHINIGYGDGASDNKPASHPVTASHSYAYGTYTVIVTIWASDGVTKVTSANCMFTVSWTAPPPPPGQPPILSNQVNPEEINTGDTYPNICVTVSATNGDSVTVIFGATYGSFTSSMITYTSTGANRVCTTYIAPRDTTAVGRNEVITYDAHDNTNGMNAVRVSSQPFPIKAPKPNP